MESVTSLEEVLIVFPQLCRFGWSCDNSMSWNYIPVAGLIFIYWSSWAILTK